MARAPDRGETPVGKHSQRRMQHRSPVADALVAGQLVYGGSWIVVLRDCVVGERGVCPGADPRRRLSVQWPARRPDSGPADSGFSAALSRHLGARQCET
jgi:hypothetical protein